MVSSEPVSYTHLDVYKRQLLNLFNTARRFNMEVQPQLVLLQKTLLYVEGVGRQLYPQMCIRDRVIPLRGRRKITGQQARTGRKQRR